MKSIAIQNLFQICSSSCRQPFVAATFAVIAIVFHAVKHFSADYAFGCVSFRVLVISHYLLQPVSINSVAQSEQASMSLPSLLKVNKYVLL
jgi:hypothetical protein